MKQKQLSHSQIVHLTKKRITYRQIDIIGGVCSGFKNKEIADELCIREKSVKDYLTNIYKVLGITSRSQLILYMQKVLDDKN